MSKYNSSLYYNELDLKGIESKTMIKDHTILSSVSINNIYYIVIIETLCHLS